MSYILGAWKAACQRCGRSLMSYDLRKEWTGLRVCSKCYDPRHPQDFLKGRADRQSPPWVSPEPPEKDVSPGSGNEITSDDL